MTVTDAGSFLGFFELILFSLLNLAITFRCIVLGGIQVCESGGSKALIAAALAYSATHRSPLPGQRHKFVLTAH